MVVMAVWLAAPGATFAQNLIGGTEELEFDRPESWGMKFFASLSLLTSMGVPERKGAGTIDLGFEGGLVPSLSEEQRRIGFNGTKLENVNRSRLFGRVRSHIGLSESTRLELAYLPPVDIGGIKPNLFAIGIGRPFSIAEHWQLVRAAISSSAASRATLLAAKTKPQRVTISNEPRSCARHRPTVQ